MNEISTHPRDYPVRPLKLDYDVADVRARYLTLATAQVYDAMELLGVAGRCMAAGVYPLVHSMKVAGPAFTVHCAATPSRDEKIHDIRLGMFASMSEGCIQVRDAAGNADTGQFGEISAVAAHAAGCRGAVLDGSTRDSNFLIDMEFATFCRFRLPVEAFGRFMAVDYQVPIYVQGIDGQLRIDPGDFMHGDNDGVVAVPRAQTLDVLTKAEEIAGGETKTRAAMKEGEDPFEVYRRYGRF